MKKQGRTVQPFTETQLAAVTEYLNSDLSGEEVANKYGVPTTTLRYWVKKYRNQNAEGKQNGQGIS